MAWRVDDMCHMVEGATFRKLEERPRSRETENARRKGPRGKRAMIRSIALLFKLARPGEGCCICEYKAVETSMLVHVKRVEGGREERKCGPAGDRPAQ